MYEPNQPDSETIKYQYDELGRPKQLKSGETTLVDVAYNFLGQIEKQALSDTLTGPNRIEIVNSYTSDSHRLQNRFATVKNTNEEVLNLTYAYDPNGNITRLTDSTLSETHFYQYDFLNRLTSAVAGNGILTNPPATPQVYGQQFEYDKVGNMLNLNNWGTPPTPLAYQDIGAPSLSRHGTNSNNSDTEQQSEQFFPASYHLPAYEQQSGSTATFTPVPPTELVAAYGFDEESGSALTDSSGNNNHGSLLNSPSWTSNGKFGAALVFDGVDDRVSVPDSNSLDLTNQITLEAWVYPTNTMSGWDTILMKEQPSSALLYTLYANGDGNAPYGFVYLDTEHGVQDTTALPLNAWSHLAMTYDGTLLKFYVNGLLKQSVSQSGSMPVTSGVLSIGGNSIWADEQFQGRIDEVRVYNKALTEQEIQVDMDLPVSGSVPISTLTPTPTHTATYTPSPVLPQETATNTSTATATRTPVPINTSPGTSTPSATITPTPITRTTTPSRTPTNTRTPTRTATATLEPGSSLSAYWDFNSATGTLVPDVAGGDQIVDNLRMYNAAHLESGGVIGSAIAFDNNNDYAQVTNSSEISSNGSFTLSAWINRSSYDASTIQYVIRKGITTNDYGFDITFNTGTATPTPPANVVGVGQIIFRVGDLTPNQVIGPVLPTETWTLVTGVYDATAKELRLYVNGSLAAVESVTGTVSMGTGNLNFSYTNNPYQGKLDDVRFYKRALTNTEVSQLFTTVATPIPSATPTLIIPPTATLVASAVPAEIRKWGTGSDGDLIVAATATYNINIDKVGQRTCADAVSYRVSSLASTFANLATTPGAGCLKLDDEVLLINLKGSTYSSYNTGTYEFLRVDSISENRVYFKTMKSHWYGEAFHSDANIGPNPSQQHVVLMRVPNYEDVEINGTLTSNAWNNKDGLIVFRVKGSLTGNTTGSITVNGLGFGGGGAGGTYLYNASYHGEDGGPGEGLGAGAGGNADGGSGGHAGYGGTSNTYGEPSLSKMYLGSGGGGGAGGVTVSDIPGGGGNGGDGGGAILIAANVVNFGGTISASGHGGQNVDIPGGHGGRGSGGSIRIEGGTITLGTVTASNNGRIAIYPDGGTQYTSSSVNPNPFVAPLGSVILPTPTITMTALTPSGIGFGGTGEDGDLSVESSTSFDTGKTNSGFRSCNDGGDNVSYIVTSLTAAWAKVNKTPASGCLKPGDEIMLINVATEASAVNKGTFEYLRVGAVLGDLVYFKTTKNNYYGPTANSDSSIPFASVLLVRVPNYKNVQIDGTLTRSTSGFIVFRVKETFSGTGTIHVNGMGSNGGGGGGTYQYGGEDIPEDGEPGAGPGGGEGGNASGGGGQPGNYGNTTAYSEPSLQKVFLGSGGGGGAGGVNASGVTGDGGNGGAGGGAILIAANEINFTGPISANGKGGHNVTSPGGDGGGGSGGSILIEGGDITLGTVSVSGGNLGRIAIYHSGDFTNSSTLCVQASVYCNNTSLATPIPTATPTLSPMNNPSTTGLVAWWSLDETSGTRSDNHSTNHLTDTNSVGFADVLRGNAAAFVNTNARLSIPDNAALSTGDINFSLVANVYLTSSSKPMIITHKGTKDTNTRDYLLRFDPATSKFTFSVGNGTAVGSVSSFETISSGQWYTIIAWHDSTSDTLNMQVDDGFVSSTNYSGGAIDSSNPMTIGAYNDGTSPGNGNIDEVAIYKRILNPAERSWLYNYGNRRTYVDVNPAFGNPGTTNLVSWWAMNEARNSTRYDSIGTNHLTNNGTVENGLGRQGGSAASFLSLTSGSLSIADNAELSTGNIDFTLVANVYLNSTTNTVVVVDKSDPANANKRDYTLFFDSTTSRFAFRIGNGVYSATAQSSETVNAGVWYTIVAWHNEPANTVNIQLNSGPISIVSFAHGASNTTGEMKVGTGSGILNATAFDGRIDEVALYKRVLTFAERTWLFNNGNGRTFAELTTTSVGWYASQYAYAGTQIASTFYKKPHAVTSLTIDQAEVASYEYDANGNVTCRIENGEGYTHEYNSENRTASIARRDDNCSGSILESWSFGYDGDGVRVSTVHFEGTSEESDLVTRYYFGGAYEISSDGSWKRYYSFAGQLVAMYNDSEEIEADKLQYFLTDHLGSVVAVINSVGTLTSQQRYMPFGEVRTISNPSPIQLATTDFGYTGQRKLDGDMGGIMDYKARFYSPYMNHFVQPDTIIPSPANPQSWNRYSYVKNSPINYADPSGHSETCGDHYCGGTPTPPPPTYEPNYCDTHPNACGTPDDKLRKDKDKKGDAGNSTIRVGFGDFDENGVPFGGGGLGTVVGDSYTIITAKHVYHSGSYFFYRTGEAAQLHYVDISQMSLEFQSNDVLVIHLPIALPTEFVPAELGYFPFQGGENVTVAYQDETRDLHTLETVVQEPPYRPGVYGGSGISVINPKGILNPGDSGGGVFYDGYLVGVSSYIGSDGPFTFPFMVFDRP